LKKKNGVSTSFPSSPQLGEPPPGETSKEKEVRGGRQKHRKTMEKNEKRGEEDRTELSDKPSSRYLEAPGAEKSKAQTPGNELVHLGKCQKGAI